MAALLVQRRSIESIKWRRVPPAVAVGVAVSASSHNHPGSDRADASTHSGQI
jgi:hypothetical protein